MCLRLHAKGHVKPRLLVLRLVGKFHRIRIDLLIYHKVLCRLLQYERWHGIAGDLLLLRSEDVGQNGCLLILAHHGHLLRPCSCQTGGLVESYEVHHLELLVVVLHVIGSSHKLIT